MKPVTKVKTVRKRLGMTQQGLANILGVDRVSVGRWETGERRPSRMAWKFMNHLLQTRGEIAIDEKEED